MLRADMVRSAEETLRASEDWARKISEGERERRGGKEGRGARLRVVIAAILNATDAGHQSKRNVREFHLLLKAESIGNND